MRIQAGQRGFLTGGDALAFFFCHFQLPTQNKVLTFFFFFFVLVSVSLYGDFVAPRWALRSLLAFLFLLAFARHPQQVRCLFAKLPLVAAGLRNVSMCAINVFYEATDAMTVIEFLVRAEKWFAGSFD